MLLPVSSSVVCELLEGVSGVTVMAVVALVIPGVALVAKENDKS